jgi:PAS domain S-box-containing protein
MFNYKELERFNIKTSQLPNSSIIVEQPKSFYARNRELVWGIIALLVVLIDLIIFQRISILKRKREERKLYRQNVQYEELNGELKYNLQKVKEQEDLFKIIAEQSGDGIIVMDTAGKLVFTNSSFSVMSGYTNEELLFMTIDEMKSDNQPIKESLLKNDLPEGKAKCYKLRHKGGSEYLAEIIRKDIHINGTAYVLGTMRDVSAQEKYKQELQEAKEIAEEGNQLKNEFIHNLSHEIRTPMNGIVGFSELLRDESLSHEQRCEFIDVVKSCGNNLLVIIDNILEISLLETKQVDVTNEVLCLNSLMQELYNKYSDKANANQLRFKFFKAKDDEQSTLSTDRSKLRKILNHLLENAFKFTNKGSVEFGYKLTSMADSITIYVKDSGIGIASNKQEMIFKRFSQAEKGLTRNAGGLGLGLAIAMENAALIDAVINVDSKLGEGSVFSLTLPYKPVIVGKNDSSKVIKKQCDNEDDFTILIVGEEKPNYLYLEALISKHNPSIRTLYVINGQEAKELCAGTERIDLVLLDVQMPLLNSINTTKDILKLRPDLPIIAQTANITDADSRKALDAGCIEFIAKPISAERLSELLDSYCSVDFA